MRTSVPLEQCLSFIHCQLQPPLPQAAFAIARGQAKAITLSRQAGCGAHLLAERLARWLQSQAPEKEPAWKVYDRDLVERVLEDHRLPKRLARYMPEDRVRQIDDIVEQLFDLHPPSEILAAQTAETILRLVEEGHVIILGRAANVVTAHVPHVLHVRLVGSMERRIQRLQYFEGFSRSEAAERIRCEDTGRQRYLKKYYDKDIDDPLLYHFVLNTDVVSPDDAARILADQAGYRAA